MSDDVRVHCVRHGGDMFGCTVWVNGRITSMLDGHFDGKRTLSEIEADVIDSERRKRAEPVIKQPGYARILRDRRIEQRISIRDMAIKLKLGTAEFSDMERGRIKPPSYRTAFLWAMRVGLSVDEAREMFEAIA